MIKEKLIILLFLIWTNLNANWEKDTQGCKVWIDESDMNISKQPIKWSGKCKEGKASGYGMIEFNYKNPYEIKNCIGTMIEGKMPQEIKCTMNNGNVFLGILHDDEIIGEALYTWEKPSCSTCPKKYIGTYYKKNFATGELILENNERRFLKYLPSIEGCLIWNSNPETNETISWSGECKNGYGEGEGKLIFKSDYQTQIIETELKKGKMDGKIVIDISYKKECKHCITHYEGTFKNDQYEKGLATLTCGEKQNIDNSNKMSAKLNEAMADTINTQHMGMIMEHMFDLN